MAAPGIVECPNCGRRNRVPPVHSGTPQCAICHAQLPWLVEAGDADFADVTEDATVAVLVDVWAAWCGPCRYMSPVIEQAARDLAGRLKVVKVNADEAPALTARFAIRGIPILLLLDHGRVVERQVGAMPGPALRRWIEQSLARSAA